MSGQSGGYGGNSYGSGGYGWPMQGGGMNQQPWWQQQQQPMQQQQPNMFGAWGHGAATQMQPMQQPPMQQPGDASLNPNQAPSNYSPNNVDIPGSFYAPPPDPVPRPFGLGQFQQPAQQAYPPQGSLINPQMRGIPGRGY